MQKLVFPEKLLQTGKGAAGDALQRRLKTLHERLKALEQDQTVLKSLGAVSKELIHPTITLHKDKGVKAYAACCLADMLRLYAPAAPYTDVHLKDIFAFMLRQVQLSLRPAILAFPAVKAKSGAHGDSSGPRMTEIPYYNEYLYVLESLATIRSVCLVPDLDASGGLVQDYVEGLFSVVRPDMPMNLLAYLQEIINIVIEESAVVPEGVVKVLLLNVDTFSEHVTHPAFLLATRVLQQQAQKLQRYLHTHFTDIADQYGSEDADDSSFAAELDKAYSLIVTLFRFCPSVTNSVVVVLENQAQGDNSVLRTYATRTLGKMFGAAVTGTAGTGVAGGMSTSIGGFGALMGTNHSTWRAWFGRRADKNVGVRLAWVESAGDVLKNHLEMRPELEAGLSDRLNDPEEKVRAAVCKLVGSLDYESAAHHVTVATLRAVGERFNDKRPNVSRQALIALGSLYQAAYPEIENEDALAISQFGWIPEEVISSLTSGGSGHLQQLRATIATDILPLSSKGDDEKAWVDRLLVVCQYLSDQQFNLLMRYSNLKYPGVQPWTTFLDSCEKHAVEGNGDVKKEANEKLENIVVKLCKSFFPESSFLSAKAHLLAFAATRDQRLFKLLRSMSDVEVNLKILVKSRVELLRRIKDTLPDALETFQSVAQLASLSIVNQTSVPHLLKRLGRAPFNAAATRSASILCFASKNCPALYKAHQTELLRCIRDTKHIVLSETAIQALANLCRYDPRSVALDDKADRLAVSLCAKGTKKQAKYAVRLLAAASKSSALSECVKSALKAITMEETSNLLAAVATLAEVAKSAPSTFEAQGEGIMDVITDQILMQDLSATPEEQEEDIWVDQNALDNKAQAKIHALKVYINRCLACTRRPNPQVVAEPLIKSLLNIISSEGGISSSTRESGALKAHLRLTSAQGLLKMAGHATLDRMIDNQAFENISMTVQDTSYKVRSQFLTKLAKLLSTRNTSPRWNIVPILVAHDPEPDNYVLGIKILTALNRQAATTGNRIERLDRPFVRLLLVLSHHPDFEGASRDDVMFMAKYISVYVDHLVNQDNIGLVFHLAGRLRTVKDKTNNDEKLYVVSELAQLLLRVRANTMGWVLATHPGKEVLPREIFQLLPTGEIAREIAKKTFLPDDAETWLTAPTKKPAHPKMPKQAADEFKPGGKAQKRQSDSKAGAKNKRRKIDQDESDEGEEDEDDSENDDSETEAARREKITFIPEEEENIEEETEPVLGRGGRRAAAKKRLAIQPKGRISPNGAPRASSSSD